MASSPSPTVSFAPSPVANQPPFSPIAELRSEHRTIERILSWLESLIAPANGKRDLDPDRARRSAQLLSSFVNQHHHTREERGLFAILYLKGTPALQGPLSVVLCHHEEIAWHIRSLEQAARAVGRSIRGATEAYANHAQGCIRFLRESIRREEEHLFPLAQKLLAGTHPSPLVDEICALEACTVQPGASQTFLRQTTDLIKRPEGL